MNISEGSENEIRSAQAVAARALAVFGTVGVALGAPRGDVVEWLKAERLWEELTPREVNFLSVEEPPERDRIEFSWQSERLIVLLWALGKVEMPKTSMQCDTSVFQQLLPPFADGSVVSFIGSARLRSDEELREKANELLKEHWSARDAVLKHKAEASKVDCEIVQERHHAINWIIGYDGLSWDDVTTDT